MVFGIMVQFKLNKHFKDVSHHSRFFVDQFYKIFIALKKTLKKKIASEKSPRTGFS